MAKSVDRRQHLIHIPNIMPYNDMVEAIREVEKISQNPIDMMLAPCKKVGHQIFLHETEKYLLAGSRRDGFKKIMLADIRYIKSIGDYVKIFTDDTIPTTVLCTMSGAATALGKHGFNRVHDSFIVNKQYEDVKHYQKIHLKNTDGTPIDIKIPIGRAYRKNAKGITLRERNRKKVKTK